MNILADVDVECRTATAPDRVRLQVARIVSHPSFVAAPLLCRLLQHLVEHALAGDVREVKEYSLGVEIFDRGASFDPRTDNIVRANVRRLRRRLEAYYEGPGHADPLVIDIPKGHYQATFRAQPATVSNGADRPSPEGKSKLPWIAASMVGAIVVLAVFVAPQRDDPSVSAPHPVRAAIFRFDTAPGDEEAAALADTIANDVVATMNANRLALISPSAFAPLGVDARVDRARELGAVYALDGDVRRDGDDFLVSFRIDELDSRTTVWAQTYRDVASATTELSVRVATQVTDSLRTISLDPNALGFGGWFEIAPDDVDSVRLLLQASHQVRTMKPDQNKDAFRTLVARYPDAAELHGAFALSLVASLGAVPPEARAAQLEEAERAAERAMALDPTRGQSYMAMADLREAQGVPAAEVAAILETGLERTPEHATVNSYYGGFLEKTGRIAAAEIYLRRAVVGDPLSAGKRLKWASNLESRGKASEAAQVLDDGVVRWPLPTLWERQLRLAFLTDPVKLDDLIADPPRDVASPAGLACWRGLAAALKTTDADIRGRDGIAAVDRCIAARVLAADFEIEARLAFGDLEGAFARANRLRRWSDVGAAALLRPHATALQRDARFMPLMHRLGMIDVWVESDVWPDFCDAPGLPYDCRTEAQRLLASG